MLEQAHNTRGESSWSEWALRSLSEPHEADRNKVILLELDQSLANSGISTEHKLTFAERIWSEFLDSLRAKLFMTAISFLITAALLTLTIWSPPDRSLIPLLYIVAALCGIGGIRCAAIALLSWIAMTRVARRIKDL